MSKLKALLLTQGMHGMVSQVEGLAKALNLNYKHQEIKLKKFWNFIPPSLTPTSMSVLESQFIFDSKVVISCGRKSVIPSLALKKKYKEKIFTIHIQDPKVSIDKFDLIICPEHDNLKGKNVIKTTGAIHYLSEKEISKGQLGAGEHSDYGMFTLLFQDGVEGLEIRDRDETWIPIESSGSSTIVNSGDLLERWTNGIYPSTLHRVKPVSGKKDRYSIALFLDPDTETLVEVIDSCTNEQRPKRFAPIRAGDYVQKRLRASHKKTFSKT